MSHCTIHYIVHEISMGYLLLEANLSLNNISHIPLLLSPGDHRFTLLMHPNHLLKFLICVNYTHVYNYA